MIRSFVHHSTIALVPPSGPADTALWERLQQTRWNLRDKGYFRWPPHVNLVYPFINPASYDAVIPALTEAASNIQPFRVTLNTFGTFGGRTRGVLWLDPHVVTTTEEGKEDPIYELQSCLMQALRSAPNNIVFSSTHSRFRPHMTLCHYSNIMAADEKAHDLSSEWITHPVTFDVNEIYIMERKGDDGQFCIAHTLPLGGASSSSSSSSSVVRTATKRFPYMPLVEDEWVRELRVGSRGGTNSGGIISRSATGQPKQSGQGRRPTTDTPEQIAAKRAQRAEKKRIIGLSTNNNPESDPLTTPDVHASVSHSNLDSSLT